MDEPSPSGNICYLYILWILQVGVHKYLDFYIQDQEQDTYLKFTYRILVSDLIPAFSVHKAIRSDEL